MILKLLHLNIAIVSHFSYSPCVFISHSSLSHHVQKYLEKKRACHTGKEGLEAEYESFAVFPRKIMFLFLQISFAFWFHPQNLVNSSKIEVRIKHYISLGLESSDYSLIIYSSSLMYIFTIDIRPKDRSEYTPSRLLQARATCNTINPEKLRI